MNCKKGDLAIIVKSMAGNEGKIVTCLEFDPAVLFVGGIFPAWRVDRLLPTDQGRLDSWVPAAWLRPIRPGDMEDETPTVRELETA
jgi:hypothetical protein